MEDRLRIIKTGESEIVEKKSRFLGVAACAESEDEARELVQSLRREHFSARHVCYAYSIGDENPRLKFSDDGEPGGTAGRPILDVIQNSGIDNIVIAVTRYFGGVLLGTGGLVRAYTEAAKAAVEAAETKVVTLSDIIKIDVSYGDFDRIKFLLEAKGVTDIIPEFTDKVSMTVTVPKLLSDEVIKEITEKTSGSAEVSVLETKVV